MNEPLITRAPFHHLNAHRCDFGGVRCDVAARMGLGLKRRNRKGWRGQKDKRAAVWMSLLLVFPYSTGVSADG